MTLVEGCVALHLGLDGNIFKDLAAVGVLQNFPVFGAATFLQEHVELALFLALRFLFSGFGNRRLVIAAARAARG